MSETWKSFRVAAKEGGWEPASYNFLGRTVRNTAAGGEYCVSIRTVSPSSRCKAPPGKARKIIGKASALGEEVYIMEGAYYDARGRILAGPGTYMFNAPRARHRGISCHLTLFIHCCSGEPDEIVSIDLIDFEPMVRP